MKTYHLCPIYPWNCRHPAQHFAELEEHPELIDPTATHDGQVTYAMNLAEALE